MNNTYFTPGGNRMQFVQRISKTDLARNTREVLNTVMRGQTALIESHGKASRDP